MNIVSRVNAITLQLEQAVKRYGHYDTDPGIINTASGPVSKMCSKMIKPGLVTSIAKFRHNINHLPLLFLIPITEHIKSVGGFIDKEPVYRGAIVRLFNNCTIVYILDFQVKIYDTKLQICNARNLKILEALVNAVCDIVSVCNTYQKKLHNIGDGAIVTACEKACQDTFITRVSNKIVIDRTFSNIEAIDRPIYKAVRHFIYEDDMTFNTFKKYIEYIFEFDVNRTLKIKLFGHVLVNRNFNVGLGINLRKFSMHLNGADNFSVIYNEILNKKWLKVAYKSDQDLSNEFRRANNASEGYDSTFIVRSNGAVTQMSIPGYEHIAYEVFYEHLIDYFNLPPTQG